MNPLMLNETVPEMEKTLAHIISLDVHVHLSYDLISPPPTIFAQMQGLLS